MLTKNNIVTIVSLAVFIGCQSPSQSPETKADTTKAAESPAVTAPPVVDDPDPTDTVPGDRYIVHTTSRQTAELVRRTLQEELRADLDKNIIDSFSRRFIFFEYDLNEDGNKEIFVGLTGPYFCGSGGCTQYLLDQQGKIITRFTVSGYPMVIDNQKTNEWKDLFIHSGGKDRIVKFNGKTYPSNPSTLPALKVLPGDGLPRVLDFEHTPYPWFRF